MQKYWNIWNFGACHPALPGTKPNTKTTWAVHLSIFCRATSYKTNNRHLPLCSRSQDKYAISRRLQCTPTSYFCHTDLWADYPLSPVQNHSYLVQIFTQGQNENPRTFYWKLSFTSLKPILLFLSSKRFYLSSIVSVLVKHKCLFTVSNTYYYGTRFKAILGYWMTDLGRWISFVCNINYL